MEVCSLSEIVADVIRTLASYAREKHITLTTEGMQARVFVKGNRQELKSAIEVLVENAFFYTPEHGRVLISVEAGDSSVTVLVRDSGIGISKEDVTHITEQFFRTKQAMLSNTEGAGLGLFLAKRIIDRHKGIMIIRSEGEGKGSIFGFTLSRVSA